MVLVVSLINVYTVSFSAFPVVGESILCWNIMNVEYNK